jgi:hypothetical protein
MNVNPAPNRAPEGVRPTLARPSRLPALLVSLAVVGGGGLLVWRYLDRSSRLPPPPPLESAAPAEAPSDADAAPEGPPPPPATTQGLLEAVSKDALLRKVLAEGDVVRRWAVVAANLALGESPRKELGALASGKFSVESVGGTTVISPASYARYDAFGDAVASIDAEALASAWRALRPALQGAYRALGYPSPTIDSAMLRALRRLEQAPVRDAPVTVEADGNVYVFADPRLEGLGQVEKHLLRMGPRNTRIVQTKAREIEAALGLAKPRVAAERR